MRPRKSGRASAMAFMTCCLVPPWKKEGQGDARAGEGGGGRSGDVKILAPSAWLAFCAHMRYVCILRNEVHDSS